MSKKEVELKCKECIFYSKALEKRDKTIADLEAKLAEKEKEYKKAMRTSLNDFLTLEVEYRKKKISFAIEQLEKVKTLCKEKYDWWENSDWEGDIYDKSDIANVYLYMKVEINEQIKQLTHQHEDKGEQYTIKQIWN